MTDLTREQRIEFEREGWLAVHEALTTHGYDSCKEVAAYYGLEQTLRMMVAMMARATPIHPDRPLPSFADIVWLYAVNLGKHPDDWATLDACT